MIDKIEDLGQQVVALWKKEGYAKEAFPTIAFQALKVQKEEERFFLALLDSVTEKEEMMRLIRAYEPRRRSIRNSLPDQKPFMHFVDVAPHLLLQ